MIKRDDKKYGILLDFVGRDSFDENDWGDIMRLLDQICLSGGPNFNIWYLLTPSEARLTVELRDVSGERLRALLMAPTWTTSYTGHAPTQNVNQNGRFLTFVCPFYRAGNDFLFSHFLLSLLT